MNLNGLELPAHYNGIGMHDSPGCYSAVWDYNQSKAHAQELRAHGATLYKILEQGTNKVQRVKAYLDQGIVVIIRPYIEKPWGRGLPVTPGDQLKPYIDAGARLIELGNEWNIQDEWAKPIPTAANIAIEVVNWWEKCLDRAAEVPGLIPLFPSNTPGGNVDHRACYLAIRAELARRGLLETVKHVAIHPRPHNNPPWVEWSATNTVTFDEWRWIRDNFQPNAYYWATEHGYSLNDDQNHNYPKIDLPKHTDYNWELLVRLDAGHADAIEPQLAGTCHWFEAGWGHWGAWGKDALRDSPAPEMPAPSPLWVRMGDQAAALDFERYGDEPPQVEQDGIDISWYQRSGMDWAAVAANNGFCYIRASYGLSLDPAVFGHTDQAIAKAPAVLRGYYHYLSPSYNAETQARFFAALCRELPMGLTPAVDVEQSGLTAAKVREFVDEFERDWGEPPVIYTRASFWNTLGDLSDVSARCPLWVAHYDVDEPTLPNGWSKWLIWQWGVKKGPEYPSAICRDVMQMDDEPEPPEPGIEVEYTSGGPYIIGDYYIARSHVTCTWPGGYTVTTTTGSKPEYGAGGFILDAPEIGDYMISIEDGTWTVTTRTGMTLWVAWV